VANFRPLDRTSLLVASAAQLALDDAGWSADRRRDQEIGLVLGTMFGSLRTIAEFDRRALTAGPKYAKPMEFANSVINAGAGQTAIWHDLRGINATVSAGSASGVQALGYAADLIRSGRAEALLAGGAEEVCFESLFGFFRAGLLCAPGNGVSPRPIPFDERRNGFAAAEGAALLALEDAAAAEARGAEVLAEIVGCGNAFDSSLGEDPLEAAAAVARAARAALEDAGLEPSDVDCVAVSANGSTEGDRYEAKGLASLFEHTRPGVASVKAGVGETLGAAGAMQTMLLLESLANERLPGIPGFEGTGTEVGLSLAADTLPLSGRRGLVHAASFDGTASALVVESVEARS
jgi:3-oxoacyl-[acyl-carrier-protein] synthase II